MSSHWWNNQFCCRFIPNDDITHIEYIKVVPSDVCQSYVGMIPNGQDLELWFKDYAGSNSCSGDGLAKGTVIHELLHALGKTSMVYSLELQ